MTTRVGHQPFEPGADPFLARVVGRGLAQGPDPLHHLGRRHRAARGVEHQPVDPLRVRGGELHRDPAAERLAAQVRPLDTERVHEAEQVVDVRVDLEVAGGVVDQP